MITVTMNTAELSGSLSRSGEALIADLNTGLIQASEYIVNRFQKNQLSGRKSDDTALNVKTGNLRGSIASMVTRNGRDFAATVLNSGATYWEYHQTGTERLPKRLFFLEDFADAGRKRYETEIERALARVGR